MPNTIFRSTQTSFSLKVGATPDIIPRVSVITKGPALGHGVMIDATTLAQVKKCAEQYSGLKVKLNHSGGVGDIVGFLTNFAITGEKLVADFHLLAKSPWREYVQELADRIPDTFGMSISFSGIPEERDGVKFARCTEIYSCDLECETAANDGLFSRRFDEWQKDKGRPTATAAGRSPKQSTQMENELLTQIGKLIDDKLAAVSAQFNTQIADLKTANTVALSKIEDVAKLSNEAADKAALSAVKEFAKTLGQPAGSAAAPSAPPVAPIVKNFEVLVREHSEYAKSKSKAITETIKAHGKEYADYLGRLQTKGEIILF